MGQSDELVWSADWAWSLPLIVATVVFHVLGLGLFNEKFVSRMERAVAGRHSTAIFGAAMSATVLLATILHGIEAAMWAVAYQLLGALADVKSAMLYSLSSMTTYGHANVYLQPHWRLMGALEALNGIILFGLTTAFLFSTIQRVWPLGARGRDAHP